MSSGSERLDIRTVSSEDKQDLVHGFEHLSDESRYRRFLSPHSHLSDAELRYFTEVDHHDHEALVAVDPRTGEGVGEARFVRSREDPHSAEMAFAVIDEWQGHRVGTRLASELARRAREEGITEFTALVLADNKAMLALARELGEVRVLDRELGAVEIAIELPEQESDSISRLVRALEAGELKPLRAPRSRVRFRDYGPQPPVMTKRRPRGWLGKDRLRRSAGGPHSWFEDGHRASCA